MTRHKWLRAEWPITMRSLASKLKLNRYSEDSSAGFFVDRVRDHSVEARFIEKIIYRDTIIDPFENISEIERLEFSQCEFIASDITPSLELINPPRSTQRFASSLIEITDFLTSISQINIDVLKWSEIFSEISNTPIIIDTIHLGEIDIYKEVRASMIIRGRNDILNVINKLTNGAKYKMDKIQIRLVEKSRDTILLSRNASAKIEAPNFEESINYLRKSLTFIIENSK